MPESRKQRRNRERHGDTRWGLIGIRRSSNAIPATDDQYLALWKFETEDELREMRERFEPVYAIDALTFIGCRCATCVTRRHRNTARYPWASARGLYLRYHHGVESARG